MVFQTINLKHLIFQKYSRKLLSKGSNLEETDFEEEIEDVIGRCKFFEKNLRSNQNKLLTAFYRTFKPTIIALFFPKIFIELIGTLKPFLIYHVLEAYVENDLLSTLYFSIALFLFEVICIIVNEIGFYSRNKLLFEWKGMMKYCMYNKTLKVMDISKKKDIVNLITGDVSTVATPLNCLYDLPGDVYRVIMSFIYLYFLLKISSLIILFILVFVLVPINFFTIKYAMNKYNEVNECSDKRIALMNDVVTNIRMIKSFFWENIYKKKVQDIRKKEINELKKTAVAWSVSALLWSTSTFLLTTVSFICYVLMDEELTVPIVFAVFSIIAAIIWPINNFSSYINNIMRGKQSLKRLETYLNLPEKKIVKKTSNVSSIVTFNNCSFTWKQKEDKIEENELILKDISLEINEKEFVIVVGEVGSGKSSLCFSLLGEMNQLKGKMTLGTKKLSYVPQKHFVRSTTVRNNILFGEEFNEKRYNKVIQMCSLNEDLDSFPLRDMQRVGEKGVTLSGGQKARISMCRALYLSNNDLFIFDDPFKDLDVTVSNHVFKSVFLEYLKDKTRVLITHQKQFLPYADKIIVMKGGKIQKIGTFEQLKNHSSVKNSSYFSNEAQRKKERKPKKERKQYNNEITSSKVKRSSNNFMNWKYVWKYFKVSPKTIIFSICLVFLKVFLENYSNYFISQWSSDPNYEKKTFKQYVFYYLSFGISTCLVVLSSQILVNFVFLQIAQYFHSKLLKSVLKAPLKWFNRTKSGEIISRFSSDQYVIQEELRWRIRMIFFTGFYVVGNYLFIYYFVPYMIFVSIPVFYVTFLIGKKFAIFFKKHSTLSKNVGSEILTHINETLDGLALIRSFNKEEMFLNDASKMMKREMLFFFSSQDVNMYVSVVARIYSTLLILFFSLICVYSNVNVTSAVFGMILSKVISTIYNTSFLITVFAGMYKTFISVEKVVEFSELESERYEGSVSVKEFPKSGEIEFKGVSFKYNDNEVENVLKNVSFCVKQGEKLGIVGRTGCGKSTTIKLLFRLFKLNAGEILIDGINIEKLSLEQLRTNLVYISQNPTMFDGSIRDNLDVQKRFNDFKIWKVLEKVNMKDKIMGLKERLNTNVKDIKFSCGEQQLICFSRALLEKKKILVLDEPTAAIDDENDKMCQNIINKRFNDCTCIIVQHRLETILDSDKILVLEKGRIIEFEAPEVLLKNEKSLFYKMVRDKRSKKAEKKI